MKKIFSFLLLTFSTFALAQTANDATFTVAEGATYTGNLTGISAQSFTVSATPKNGTVTIQNDGSFTYVHNGAESTSDSFTFTVSDSNNTTSSAATVTITVTPVNDVPTVTATATKTINEGETVTLVVSGTDTEGATLVYEVTTPPTEGTFLINKSTGSGTYVHGGGEASSDKIVVKVKESDYNASFSSQTITITVTGINDAPIAPDLTIDVSEGGTSQPYSFGAYDAEISSISTTNNDAIGNNTAGSLTYSITSQGLYGKATAGTDGTVTYVHAGSENNKDTFSYSVSDGTLTSSGEVTVNVSPTNDAPSGVADTYFVHKTGSIQIPAETGLLRNDIDLDSDFELLQVLAGQTPAKYGDVNLSPDGSFVYTTSTSTTISDNTTSDTFTYVVYDGEFNSSETTVTIEFTNLYGANHFYSTTEGGTLQVVDSLGVLKSAYESNNLALTAVVDTKPSHGTVEIGTNGSFNYVHDGSENRIDSFTYKVQNANEDESKPSFVIIKNTNVNDAPTSSGSKITVAEGGSVIFTPSYVDTDTPLSDMVFEVPTSTSNGIIYPSEIGNQFIYKHNGGETSTDVFDYTVYDGIADKLTDLTANITITSVNDAPVANEQSVTVSEGAQDVPITFTGTDAESDALTYKLVTQPANGNVSVSSTGTFTYTHDGVQVDNDSFLIVANDGSSDSAQTQISITVNLVDDKPVVSPLSLSIAEGASTTFNLGNNISDEEGASLSLAITQLPSDGVLTYGGAQISSGDLPKTFSGDLIYIHNGGESKSDVFQFQAYTGNSIPVNSEGALDASSSALSEIGKVKVSFSSVNDAPVIGDLTIAVDQFDETSFVVPATDAETEDLTYNISSEPSKGSLLSNGGNSYTYFNASSTDLTGSSETDSFTIEVSDGDLTVSKAYTITVNGINEDLPQVILTSSSNTMTETTGGSAATQTITATLVSNDFFSDRRDMDAVPVAKGSTNSQGYVYLGEYGGHYYYLHKEHKSWGDAKNAALTRGGYLVALETQAEMNAVKTLMDDINEMNWIWLGLSYNIELSGSNITTNKWKWSNGASLENNSTLWKDGNTWDSSNDGTYLNVSKASWYPSNQNTRNGVSNIGFMNNEYENNHFWYIVEYDNALTAAQNITFTVDAASSSTAVKDTDFSLSATSLTIASGSSGTSFVVTEIQDSVGENNETIVLEASNVSSNARLKNSQKSITIELLDNENTTVGISANSTNVNEASGSVTLTATLGKTRPTDTDITLNFSGTATIDEDYATNDDVYFTTIATSFSNAEGAVQATSGDYYVAQERTLFKVTSDGTKTIISGDGNWGNHSTEAQGASQAKFSNIGKMVIDKASAYSFGARDGDSSTAPQDVIYFYDETIIRKLDLGNNIMYYITGSSDHSQNFVNGSFVEARFNQIRDITLSNDGNKLYVIDRNGIRTIDLANETVSTLTGQNDWGYQDGTLSSAQFEGPEGLAMDSYGDLFVRQYGKIRKIDIDGDSVTTVLENDWHSGDLIIDPNNNIYYAGRDNNQIYLLTGGVSEISGAKPLTGLGELSLIVDSSADPGTVDGLKGVAKIESPAEIFYDGSGLVFVQSKSSNGSLRKIDFATKLRIPKGQTTGTFTFDVTDDTSYENDETIQVKISSAPLLTFDSAVVQETITINGSDSSLAGYDAKPQVQLTSAKTSISESGSNNSTILTFQLGDASESGARLDMSPGLKKDYEYLGSIGTHKYYMSYDHESWTRANEIASSAGGYLLVLDDASENTWVNSNIPDDYRWNSFWMGYHDSVNEGDFQWVNGSDSSYTNWNNGEPNNAGGEDYVELLNNGRWNDLPNNHHRRFIIEFSGTVSSLPTQITYTVTGDTAEFNYPTVAPITIAAGETTATVTVAANADTDDEGADAITYTITSAGSNGTVGAKDAVTVSIDDDDNPSVTLAAPSDTSFNEKNGTLAISATIDNIKPFATSLGLTINGGGSDTAVLGDDYEIAELSSVTTFAGSGISGYTDETGASAQFDQPSGMTLDSSGNLYVADRENQVIRKITPSGVVTTFAGNGEWAHDREEGPKLEVGITNPRALAFDSNGDLYVGENGRNRISKIDTNGNVTHVIGQGDHGDSDGDKTQAQFNWISGMVFDSAGNLFVADAGSGKIKKITFAAGTNAATSTTFAGTGNWGYNDGAGNQAEFREPYALTIDSNDNLYVADRHNQRIRKITSDGIVSTFAGDGWGSQDGSLANARFQGPTGISIDSNGDFYVIDREASSIRFIDVSAGTVSTLTGGGGYGHVDGSFETARFKEPLAVAVGSSSLYISDESSHRIREIKLLPQIIIPAGQTTGTLTLSGIDDYVYEADESISITVSGVTNASNSVGSFSALAATIVSEDAQPIASISAEDDILEEEGAGTLNIKVSLSDVYSSAKTDMDKSNKADYYYLGEFNGSKYYGSKDHSNSGYLAFDDANAKALELGGQLAVITSAAEQEAVVNGIFQNDPRFQKDDNRWLNHWIGYEYDDSSNVWGWKNLIGSDFEVWSDDWQKNEHPNRKGAWLHSDGLWHSGRNNDTRLYIVEFSSAISDSNTNVEITFADLNSSGVSLTGAGADFTSNLSGAGIFTIPAGNPSGNIVLTAVNDTENESVENFSVTLASATGASVNTNAANNSLNVTISDDEKPVVTLSIVDAVASISEVGGQATIKASTVNTKLFPVTVDLAFANSGNLIALFDKDYNSKDLNAVSNWVGKGRNGYVDGDADEAEFSNNVRNMTSDAQGNIYIADTENRAIRKIDTDGNVTTWAGGGNNWNSYSDEDKLNIGINGPTGMVFDSSGNAYISVEWDNKILKINSQGIANVWANKKQEHGRNNGPVEDATFKSPRDLAFDSNGNLFVLENHSIRKIVFSGASAVVEDFVGNGDWGQEDGTGTEARFSEAWNLVIDPYDNIFFTDIHHNKIRMATPDGVVTTIAGNGNWGYSDGNGNNARFKNPYGLALDSNNDLFVNDTQNNRIRKISLSRDANGKVLGSNVSTLAGNGNYGTVNGTADVAEFKSLEAMIVLNGVLYTYDRDESMFRQVLLNPVMTIPAGSNSATFNISGIDDSVYESDETISVTPSTSQATLASSNPLSLTLTSDELTPKVEISSFDSVVDENGSPIEILVGLTDASGAAAVWEQNELPVSSSSSYDFMGEFEGHKYYFSKFSQNYFQALDIAEELGGRLLVIESQEENDFISSIMIHDGTWIGHFRSDMDDTWKNIYGSSSFTNYENANDFSDYYGYAITYGQRWYNQNAYDEKHFVIEYGPVTSSELESKVQLVLTGTAVDGVDYQLSNSVATIAAGATNATINLSGINDNLEEPIETINVSLALINDENGASVSNVNLGEKISLDLVVNDDEVPIITFSNSSNEISENGGQTTLTANLSNAKLYPTTINLDLKGDSEVLLDYNVSSILSYKSFVGGLNQAGSSYGKMENVRFDSPTHLSHYNSYKYPDGYYLQNMLISDNGAHTLNYAFTDGANYGNVISWFGKSYEGGNPEADTIDQIRLQHPEEFAQFQGLVGSKEEYKNDNNPNGLYLARPSLVFFYQSNVIYFWDTSNDTTTIFKHGGSDNSFGSVGGIEAVERNGKMEVYFTDSDRETLNKFTYNGDGTSYSSSNWTLSKVAGEVNNKRYYWDDDNSINNDPNNNAFNEGYSFDGPSFAHPSSLTYDALNDRMFISTGRVNDSWDGKGRIQVADFATNRVYSLNTQKYIEAATGFKPEFGQIGIDSKGALYIPVQNLNFVVKVDMTYDNNNNPVYGGDYVSQTIANSRINRPSSVLIQNGKAYIANQGSNVVDEVNLSANISIAAGQTEASITLGAFKDPWFEDNEIIDIDIDAISNGFAGVKNDAGEVVSTQTDIAEVTIVESTRLTLVQDAPFQGVENGKVSWGDYDKDGDMDLALMGSASTGTITNVYINNDGVFVNTNQNFTKYIGGDIEFVDVDQDGYLDVAVSGNAEGGVRKSELYKNVLGAFFEKMDDYNVEGLSQTDMEWGDLDNDGDPDLIISGIDLNSEFQTQYYTNLGDFNFLKENLFYDEGVINGEIDIVDADQDGDNDLFTNGTSGDTSNPRTHNNVFQNTYYRESYQEQGSDNSDGLNVAPGKKNGNTIYADIDGDGELDFLAMGENQQGNIDIGTNLAALDNLPKLKNVDFDFADYNNDGQSDLIISGEDKDSGLAVTKLYTTFPAYFGDQYGIIESDLSLVGLRKSSVDWIDYDNDGDLDLFVTGLDDSGNAKALLYKAENTNNLNTAPEKITGLAATHNGVGGVTFTWDKPKDNSSKTFRYSMRIGTESGGDDVVYSNSDPTTGNTLINIPSLSTLNSRGAILNPGTYYASVQAIDGGNMGGPFSDEVEITLDYDWKLLNLGGIIDRRLIPRESTQLEFMDMDGDGDKDLISTNVGMRPNRIADYGYDIRQRGINIYAFDNEVFVPVFAEFDGETNFEFGDLNNDGQQDLIVAVEETGGTRIHVLLNTRVRDDAREDNPNTPNTNEGLYREFFTPAYPFQGGGNNDNYFSNLFNIKFAVGDLNNDGLVEIIAAGQSSKLSNEATTVMAMVSVVDSNPDIDGLGFDQFVFSEISSVVDEEKLSNLSFASYDFGDIDNDGDFDFLISGYSFNGYKTILFENKRAVDEDGVVIQPIEVYFEEKAQDFVSVKQGTSDFVDFDADGKLDILFSGQSASGDLVKAYKNLGAGNNGEGFVDMNVGLPAVREGKFVFGDFDSNGYKDVLYSGVVAGQGKITKLSTWVEELGKMIDSPYDLSVYQNANMGVADFDGDLDADIVITGKNKYVDNAFDYFNQYISDVFINVRGFAGDFAGGDDNDSTGSNERDGSPLKKSIGVKKVYGFNARPNPPTSVDFQRQRLSAVLPDGNDNGGDRISSNADSSTSDPLFELLITWAGATDNWGNGKRTPAAGLTYSVRIGTTPGGEEILASGSDIDGVKAVADTGNAENNLSWKLNVPLGEYYVAVQSIDASFVGSEFTEEKQYTVTSAFKLGDSNGDDGINILDLTTNLDYILGKNPKVFVDEVADVNNDGKIDVTDISAIVNLILNAKEGMAQGVNYNPYDWDYFSNKPVGEATLVYTNNRIYLENEKPVTSLQFSIDSTIDYELSERLNDLSVVSFVKDGKRNFLIYSYNNQPINDLTNILFDYVDVNENDKFKIEDLRAGTNDGLVLDLRYSDESFFDSLDDSIQMYPNPAISNVNLLTKVSKKVKTLQVNIYNVLGVSVYNTTIDTMGRLNDLDVSMLSSGLYTVQVKMITNENEEIVSVHKLIKK